MNMNTYQRKSQKTAIYPNKGNNLIYPVLGLCGEAGEVAEKVKKQIRDHEGEVDQTFREAIRKELGDVLWYVAAITTELGMDLSWVAEENIEKLRSRGARGTLHGSGDNR